MAKIDPTLTPEEIAAREEVQTHYATLAHPEIPHANVILDGIRTLQKMAHRNSSKAGWWKRKDGTTDLLADPEMAPYVICTKIMLMVSEVVEAMEGDRSDLMDDKLPHRKQLEVELGDLILRALDLAGKLKLDVAGAIIEKAIYNLTRADHKPENRNKKGGKKY